MKVKVTVLACVVVVLAALGWFLFLSPSVELESTSVVGEGQQFKPADLPEDLLKKRGPRPDTGRLRDGARQVEEKADALKVAQEALQRVEQEIAGTSDQLALEKLAKKKELIEKSIAHLGGGGR